MPSRGVTGKPGYDSLPRSGFPFILSAHGLRPVRSSGPEGSRLSGLPPIDYSTN